MVHPDLGGATERCASVIHPDVHSVNVASKPLGQVDGRRAAATRDAKHPIAEPETDQFAQVLGQRQTPG